MKDWRKLTWFILIVQVIFVIWIIGGANSAASNCDDVPANELELCQAATAVGAGIGIALIIFLWIFVDVVLGLIWLVTNRKSRVCPACGSNAKKGQTTCKNCGHDFAAAARASGG